MPSVKKSFVHLSKTVQRSILGAVLFLVILFASQVNAQTRETFENPPQESSANGVLEVDLVVAPATFEINGQTVTSNVYNGQFTPPVLRVRPGDEIRGHLSNQSDQPTNVHHHGFNVSPIPPADNIFVQTDPGEDSDYRISIPAEHRSGTFWYHSHLHGLTEPQVLAGMSGALIIEGLSDHLPQDLRNIQERIMLLADIPIKDGQIPPDFDSADPTNRTLNGLTNPTVHIAPGETQLWRIANMSADIYYQLQLQRHKLAIVGMDGSPVNTVKQVETLLVPPGGRFDVLVQGGRRGTYKFQTLQYSTGSDGDQYPKVTLATVRSQGQPQNPATIPTELLYPLPDLRQATITQDRTLIFSDAADGDTFLINGKEFDHSRIDTPITLGAIEKWTIKNTSNEQHVFHIHQTDFQVVSINGEPQDFYGYNDIANIPEQGEIEIIIPFTDPVIVGAPFVYHCHILAHEDKGMMGIAQVSASTTSAPSRSIPSNSSHMSHSLSH